MSKVIKAILGPPLIIAAFALIGIAVVTYPQVFAIIVLLGAWAFFSVLWYDS